MSTAPEYIPDFASTALAVFLDDVPWLRETETRQECFMSDPIQSYTYGQGRGVRTYTSIPYQGPVLELMHTLNAATGATFNGCFLNRYDDHRQHLGWHADDFERMDQDHPVAVLSFGEPREIWWRPDGQKGVVPDEQRQLLDHGSLFVMPSGFQRNHQHRIPKGSREMGPRVSLTYRRFLAA